MATDKRINYSMQGHKKPARNYLGKQKTVKNIPIKWKSGPKAPQTELAYITKKEKDLLIKKDLHGSLKHGPNTGPDGIMSLDSQGDYTPDRSPGGGGGGGGRGPSAQASEAHMRAILTGQKNIGQTAAVSDRVRRGAVPEYVYGPDGKPKYVGSAYKSTGQRGFLSKLFGGRGYRGTVGTGSGRFLDRKSTIKFNPTTGRYESEEEDVGDIKPGFGGRILGGLAGLATGIPFVGPMIGGAIDRYTPKPRDMSQFNKLGAAQTGVASNVPMARIDRWNTPAVTGTDQDYQTALGEGWATDYTGDDIDTNPNYTSFKGSLPLGSAEGGRIGYAYGTSDPEEPAEDIYEIMRGENIPHGEQVEEGITEEQTAMILDMLEREMDIPTIMSITGASEADIMSLMGDTSMAPDSADEGLASLV